VFIADRNHVELVVNLGFWICETLLKVQFIEENAMGYTGTLGDSNGARSCLYCLVLQELGGVCCGELSTDFKFRDQGCPESLVFTLYCTVEDARNTIQEIKGFCAPLEPGFRF